MYVTVQRSIVSIVGVRYEEEAVREPCQPYGLQKLTTDAYLYVCPTIAASFYQTTSENIST